MTSSISTRPRLVAASGALAALAILAVSNLAAAQQALPEEMGPYAFQQWLDAPNPPIPIPPADNTGVFYPTNAPCPGAVLVLVHGYGELGAYKKKMAELLVTRGFVVVAPDFLGGLANPQPSDGDLLNQLFDWVVALANDPSTPIAGKVDPSQFGIAGHSNGGVVYYAAETNPKIKAVIGWDAVTARSHAANIHGPSLHLVEEGRFCGGGLTDGYDVAPPPKAKGVITGGHHCDFDDPQGPLCVTICGQPPYNPAAAAIIERYSVAWFTCLLGHDPTMKQYLDFSGAPEGLSQPAMVGTIECQPTCSGGPDAGSKADAGRSKAAPAGASDKAGCGCRTTTRGPPDGAPTLAVALCALLVGRRRRSP